MITAIGLVVFIVAAAADELTINGYTVWNYDRDDPKCDARSVKDAVPPQPCGPSTEPTKAPIKPPQKCCRDDSHCHKNGDQYLCVQGVVPDVEGPDTWRYPKFLKKPSIKKPSPWVNVGRLLPVSKSVNVNKKMPVSKSKVISAFHGPPLAKKPLF